MEQSGRLKTYQGVANYCLQKEYRNSINETLKIIHHYDSMILSKLEDPEAYSSWNLKEEKKAVKDLYEMEAEFSAKNFIVHMTDTCKFRKDIEKGSKEVSAELGIDSQDGQVIILESELRRYLSKIDKLILHIDDHLHILHIDK